MSPAAAIAPAALLDSARSRGLFEKLRSCSMGGTFWRSSPDSSNFNGVLSRLEIELDCDTYDNGFRANVTPKTIRRKVSEVRYQNTG